MIINNACVYLTGRKEEGERERNGEREMERKIERRERKTGHTREWEGETWGHACKIMLTNSESQVSHHVLVILYGTCSKMHKR
ncbi:MAG: hypothetical protein MJE68_06040 [Proteobacteria bacterium]|nr:hypothetical protein [Pseudomonadota bacterium]